MMRQDIGGKEVFRKSGGVLCASNPVSRAVGNVKTRARELIQPVCWHPSTGKNGVPCPKCYERHLHRRSLYIHIPGIWNLLCDRRFFAAWPQHAQRWFCIRWRNSKHLTATPELLCLKLAAHLYQPYPVWRFNLIFYIPVLLPYHRSGIERFKPVFRTLRPGCITCPLLTLTCCWPSNLNDLSLRGFADGRCDFVKVVPAGYLRYRNAVAVFCVSASASCCWIWPCGLNGRWSLASFFWFFWKLFTGSKTVPSDSVASLATPASSPTIDAEGWTGVDNFTFCLNTDVPLYRRTGWQWHFHNTRDLTAVPVAHPAQFRQKNTAVFPWSSLTPCG